MEERAINLPEARGSRMNMTTTKLSSSFESTAVALRTLLARAPMSAKHEKLKQQGQLGRLTAPAPTVQQRLQSNGRQRPSLARVSILGGEDAGAAPSSPTRSGRARDVFQVYAERITAREFNIAEQFREDFPEWAVAIRYASMPHTEAIRAPLGPRHGGVPDYLRAAWLRIEQIRKGLDPDLWDVLRWIVAREPCEISGRLMSLHDVGSLFIRKPYDKDANNSLVGLGVLKTALRQTRSILQNG